MFKELLNKILKREIALDPTNPEHMQLLEKLKGSLNLFGNIYNKMYEYYKGNTDAIEGYLFIEKRSNLKIHANYIKKFIKEEVSYTVGNDITYESRSNNNQFIKDIDYYTAHWDEKHDSELMKYLLIFTTIYELYYIDENGDFCTRIIKPTEGYVYIDNKTQRIFAFIHKIKDDLTNEVTYDIYTDDYIYTFDSQLKLKNVDKNIFGKVPVTVGKLSEEGADDSLYKDIKGLQDAFETNLSDIGNEISDFRNAYLLFMNCRIDEDKVEDMKKLGIIQLPGEKAAAKWLIKDINDTFIQNTLDRYEDTMYQLACHINHNEKLQSNLSGVALESRLIALRNKCTLEIKAHKNMVKNRIMFLCIYLSKKRKNYDYKDIKPIYTPNVPRDDAATADIISKLPEGMISKDTLRGRFSFINNKVVEDEKVKKEQKEELENENFNFKDNHNINNPEGDE